jgi:hydrogenase small subunit
MALPPAMATRIAEALEQAKRPSVIWMSFQQCTGCLESLTRSHAPSVAGLIFDSISLGYQETLQRLPAPPPSTHAKRR